MRRLLLALVTVVSLTLTGVLAGHTAAQDATPEAAPFPPGVTAQPLALGLAALPGETDFDLFRWTLEPGTVFAESPLDPAVALLYVEDGTLTVDFAAPLTIERGAAIAVLATPGVTMPQPEHIAADATATLAAGDSVVIPLHAQGELRNDGSEPVIFLTALVTPREGALPLEAPMAATPSA
jgi:hypothetical protein